MLGSRIVRMSIGETSIRMPHHRLEFEELIKEARLHVVDLLCVEGYYMTYQPFIPLLRPPKPTLSVLVGLDVPQRILPGWVFVARHLIILSIHYRSYRPTSCCSKPHSGSLTLCENK